MQLDSTSQWENDVVRLFLLQPQHVGEAYVRWLNDPEIGQFLESRFAHHDSASTIAFVKSMSESPNNLFLGIESKALGRHVGNIKLGPIDRKHGLGEIGLMIGERDAWGKGVATNAINLITNIGIAQLGLRKITAGCYASNIGSKIAFEKAGFSVEATRKDHFLFEGRGEDLILLARFSPAT
jgi:[ribosomal protein S5]-alanine N-acetyltransferase